MLKIVLAKEVEEFDVTATNMNVEETVQNIIMDVKKNKDKALKKYTSLFDNTEIDSFLVTQTEIDTAYQSIDKTTISDLELAYQNILKYHKKQQRTGYKQEVLSSSYVGQRVTPIDAVGLYVPGGTAPLPSSVLMNAAPAVVAKVPRIVLVTPPQKNGNVSDIILAACKIVGIKEVYKVGGAQAIAALAYGTESIPPVNKIVGPGNIYVATAKKQVFGKVGIDMIAGPSEVLVYADSQANPTYIAADLLSQAEHDVLAKSILVTTSNGIISKVNEELIRQSKILSRYEIIKKALSNNSFAVLVENKEEAYEVINKLAPEHLEILVQYPYEELEKIRNAGAIFIGEYSPEPLGDYFAGPNHTLPTSGTAKYSSPLNVDDFIKKTSIIYYSKEDLLKVKDSIINIAEKEQLTAHANAIKERFKWSNQIKISKS